MIERLAIGTALLLAGATAAIAQPAEVELGRGAFQASCALCHGIKPGERRLGPSLAGVAGRPAGSIPGFAYSPALVKSGFRWDDAHLTAFLAAPQKTVPGTRMIYPGMADPAKRKAVIAYLKTLPAK